MSQKEVNTKFDFDTNVFKERFHELRKSLNQSQSEFAEFLEIPTGSVGGYESGAKAPNSATLFKIAKKCNVSADYLLGLQENQCLDESVKAVHNYIGLSDTSIELLHEIKTIGNSSTLETLSELIECDELDLLDVVEMIFDYKEEFKKAEARAQKKIEETTEISVSELWAFSNDTEKDYRLAAILYYQAMDMFRKLTNKYLDKYSAFLSGDNNVLKLMLAMSAKLSESERQAYQENPNKFWKKIKAGEADGEQN